MLLLGAECHPTAAPCSGDSDGDGKLDCNQGEYAACLNMCLELGDEGDACVVDPCQAGSGATVCRTGLVCLGGTCGSTPTLPLQGCDPNILAGQPGSCSSGTHCVAFDDCEDWGIERPPWLRRTAPDGMCLLPAQEGERCDGESTELEVRARCRPCAPGLFCESAPWDGSIDVCQRPCDDDDDCPCRVSSEEDEEVGCNDGWCRICSDNGLECIPGGPGCCDPDAECAQVVVVEDGAMSLTRDTCCRPVGTQCSSDSECCANARCNGGQCQGCGSFPGAPPGPAGCCPGLVLRVPLGDEPVCGRPCPRAELDEGEPQRVCRTDGGVCGAAQLWQCDPVLGDYCPDEEEDPIGQRCVHAELSATCGEHIQGAFECDGDELVCLADICMSPDFAWHCGEGICYPTPDHIPVNEFSCNDNKDCAPGSYCGGVHVEGTTHYISRACVCCENSTAPMCWKPRTGGGCPGG